MWVAFAFAVVGPLFLTNILWFTAIGRVGPSRASLFANLQPFFARRRSRSSCSREHLNRWEVVGGFAIARRDRRSSAAPACRLRRRRD